MRIALVVLLFLASPARAAPPLARVPVVGCPSDGQQGPQPAPPGGWRRLALPTRAAARLALYRTRDAEALAPRGWHCAGTMGSNGDAITVTPAAPGSGRGLRGPAVLRATSYGGTSGRFEVAEIAARLFPSARVFVDRVAAEDASGTKLVRAPYPADRLLARTATRVRYVTPPGAEGLGTRYALAPGPLPVDGIERIFPERDMDLLSIAVRLPPGQRDLAPAILAGTEALAR